MNPAGEATDLSVAIQNETDIVTARMRGRALALQIGFSPAQATLLATAISELARNILLYAQRGEVVLSVLENSHQAGVSVVARDVGPGIADLSRALEDGYSTSGRLGLGLPGVRRLADSFEIRSSPEGGTIVVVKMWCP
ncbi:MAG: anti-sigma regulatory factor [Candidatus Eisenbacteria bacterium]|uniref:Anti-sigma regulatory factor n=1 Tax=Eiseniibacteriota bacterium TaxID=2212470 RepID=A0A538UDD5_UNCEI|nr:MAG: anti-sigma regulatory factor [Candidatus Eisenbacteria bacterium]